MTVRLSTLARRKGPLSAKEFDQLQRWLDDDWESHDIDRDAVRLINRLALTVRRTKWRTTTTQERIK